MADDIVDKKEEKKPYIIDNISKLLKTDQNPKLEELCFNLINFKIEKQRHIDEKITSNDSFNFRNNLFNELEILLCQASYLKKKTRKEKILTIYNWYKEKMKSFFSLFMMGSQTYDNLQTNTHAEETKSKISEDHPKKESRNIYPEIKTAIQEYKVKKITPKKGVEKKTNHRRSFISEEDKVEFYFPKGRQKVFTRNSVLNQKKMFSKEITKKKCCESCNSIGSSNPPKELKFSYSCSVPKLTVAQGTIENQILKEKQKSLSMKKSQEQVKSAINDFGAKRAEFKCNQIRNEEIKNLLKKFSEETEPIKTKRIKIKSNPTRSTKVTVDNVKNINKEDKTVIQNDNEVCIELNLKMNPISAKEANIKSYVSKNREYPSEGIMHQLSHDSIFKARMGYKGICNFSEISPASDMRKSGGLSVYAEHKSDIKVPKIKISRREDHAELSSRDFLLSNIANCSGDYLYLRRTISNLHENEVNKLHRMMIHRSKLSKSVLENAYKSPEKSIFFSNYYLPINGSGLMRKPPEKERILK